jgi:putative cell wall-binding protein
MLEDMKSGGFTRAIIVGGTSAVSSQVATQLASVVGATNVIRLAGADRYATSLAIARFECAEAGMKADGAAIATGRNFPDALAGASLLGKSGSVLLLADPGNSTTLSLLTEMRDDVTLVRFLGGEAVVSSSVRLAAVDALLWDRKVLGY